MARKRSQDPEQGKRQAHVQRSMRANIFDGEQVVLVAHPGRLATLPKFILTLGREQCHAPEKTEI